MLAILPVALDAASLEERIYEASVLPEFWRPVLQDFARFADSSEAIVVATNGVDSRWVASSDYYSERAFEHYSYPTGQERTRRLIARKHAGFLTDMDVFDIEELRNDPLYVEMMIPNGYGRGIATAIDVPGGDTIVVHAEGPFSSVPIAAKLRGRLDAMRPHLARSALISSRLAFERARTAVDTLQGLGFSACAVGSNGIVLVANEAFGQDAQFWTTRGKNRIALFDKRGDQLLNEALGVIGKGGGVYSLPLAATEATTAAVLHIVPIRRAAHDLFAQASAILVLTKASMTPTASTPLLQALFDLSLTEAALAARIAAGQTVEHIAAADRKSVHTVRNQLKSVLAKTGCARQTELARLLSQLLPT